MKRIPITMLTGFLGSGKTTLLSRILRDERFTKTAVIINEFGDVDLDGVLVEHSPEQIVETTTGCLCCTLRGDVQTTLLDLHERRKSGSILPFERLIIETTGLADPDPVIYTVMGDIRLARIFELAGVVTVVDAVNGANTLFEHEECVRQAAVADRIVLTKSDLVVTESGRRDTQAFVAHLKTINPAAPVLLNRDRSFDMKSLFDTSLHDARGRGRNVLKWLNSEAYLDRTAARAAPPPQDAVKDGHAEIQSYCVVFEKPVAFAAFAFSLEVLLGMQGPELLRFKGIVNVQGHPERPIVLHAVQRVVGEPVWLKSWPSEDRRTRLVFIGRNIPKASIEKFFEAWQDTAVDPALVATAPMAS